MGAIGDYIHLTYAGYHDGTGYKREPYYASFASCLSSREAQLQTWINKQDKGAKTKLEKQLNKELKLLKNMQDSSRINISDFSEEELAMLEDLRDVLPDKYIKFDVIAAASNNILSTGGIYTGNRIAGKGKTALLQAQTKRIQNQIQDYVDTYTKNTTKEIKKIQSENDQKQLLELLNIINNEEKAFLKRVKNLKTSSGGGYDPELKSLTKVIDKSLKQISNMIETENGNAILQSLQKYAQALSSSLSVSEVKGDMGEAIANIAGKQIGAVAGSEVEKVMTEGSLTSNRGLNKAYFTSNTNFSSLLENHNQDQIGDFIITSKGLQDKVDVGITLANKNEINLSVKTYDITGSSKKIGFAAANLLELLQNENQDNFINHYLNINAIKGFQNSNDKQQINDLIKKIIMAKLIAGYNYETQNGNMKEANYFVVIDNKNYTAKVYSMKNLLNSLINDKRYNQVKLPTGFIAANKRQLHISDRLTNVMKVLAVNSKVRMTVSNVDLKNLK